MYLAIDIGGTKTLVTCFDKDGTLREQLRFLTPRDYRLFIRQIAKSVADLSTKHFVAAGVALPGLVDRDHGTGIAFGNLPWQNVSIVKDIERITDCPVYIENDANLAGLSEAELLQDEFSKVLYVTISTGIGTGVIIDQQIDPDFADSEGGHIVLEHHGRRQMWEKFASGSAIVRRFGKRAQDITDIKTWRVIARDIATGLTDLSAIIQPDVIVLGGGVSTYFDQFAPYIKEEMKHFSTPLTKVPALRRAQRPEEAVAYGCYLLAKEKHARSRSKAAV
ncbi:MAG TPA: ROK family protein [Candidatus Saccharimonadales bacterium]|nr:ROK family protein [Candidatus Saccharimonadales bacterium]